MVCLDGLDLPLLKTLDVIFAEHAVTEQYGVTKPDDVSTRLYHQSGLRPASAGSAARFAFTDIPVQALGLYREEPYPANGGHQPVL